MKKYRKHIDDFFREKLGRYAETPPPEVWEDLEKRLDGLPPLPGNTSYRWARHFAIVSVIVLLSVPFLKKVTGDGTTQSGIMTSPSAVADNAQAADLKNDVHSAAAAPAQQNGVAGNIAETNANEPAANGSVATAPAPIAVQNAATNNSNGSENNRSASGKTIATNSGKVSHRRASSGARHTGYVLNAANNTAENANSNYARYASNITPAGDHAADPIENALPLNASSDNNKLTPPEEPKEKKENKDEKKETVKKDDEAPKRIKPTYDRFELGFKAGYEKGFNNAAASKFVVGPYLQYNVSRRLSVMTQPAVKYANVDSRHIGPTQSYYKVNPDGTVKQNWDSVSITVDGSSIDTTHRTSYHYSQSHDSIVKSYTYGGSYFEADLPLLLKYAVTEKLAFYGGVNMAYSQLATVSEHTYTQQNIMSSADRTTSGNSAQMPAPSPISDIITYSGTPYSNYSAPLFSIAQKSQLSVGYMLGFSYEYSKKWLFDALVQQTNIKPSIQGGYNVNAPLSMPYFRLSIGYKLLKK